MQVILVALFGLLRPSSQNESSTALGRVLGETGSAEVSSGAVGPNSRLAVDADTAHMVINTISRDLLRWFDRLTRVGAPRNDEEWFRLACECDQLAAALRGLVRSGSARLVEPTLRAFEAEHSCEIELLDAGSEAQFAKPLHLALARVVEDWAAIARGTKLVTEATVAIGPLVPLSTVWGRTAKSCLNARLRERTRRYSATKKLKLVAHEMEAVLGRAPVECMRPEHVARYVELLRANGSTVGTIANKLGVLAALVKGVAPQDTLDALKQKRPPRRAIEALRTKRRPMSQGELGAFLQAIFSDTSLHPDDRVIVALTALTSARIDEVASLQARDIRWDGQTWSMAIALSDEERESLLKWLPQGFALPGLKGVDSLRTIPVCAHAIPGLHERLLELGKRSGSLFAHLNTTSAGRRASAIGQRINRRMKEVFGPETDLVFESLRNTASPTLRRAGINLDLRRLHLGHAPIDIHARHYDEVSFDDLRGGARVIADFVRGALDGKQVARLDIGYDMCRRVLKHNRTMLDKDGETRPVQQRPLDADKAKVVSLAQARLKLPPKKIAAGARPSRSVVVGMHPNLEPQVARQQEVATL